MADQKIKILDKEYSLTEIAEHESFCVLPWIHFHAWPEGKIYPCCRGDFNDPLNQYTGQNMQELMNNDKFKKLRLDMLNGEKPSACSFCYRHEKDFKVSESPRQHHNKTYLEKGVATDEIIEILKTTKPDGEIDFKLLYVDIRFSNICNFKCRTCSSGLSSSIASEYLAFHGKHDGFVPYGKNGLISLGEVSPTLINDILRDESIDSIRRVYFAGAEPLITHEHYQILERLIERDNHRINLLYNTNFSNLVYKGKNVLDYWERFPFLNVGTSVDDFGPRLEYLRNGAKWNVIKNNYEKFFEKIHTANEKIYNSITVSFFNVFYLDEIIKVFFEEIGVESIQLQMVFGPEMMCVTSLPQSAKQVITKKLGEFIDSYLIEPKHSRTKEELHYVINVMNAKDSSHLLPELAKHTLHHDKLRNESFVKVYPELDKLTGLSKNFKDSLEEI